MKPRRHKFSEDFWNNPSFPLKSSNLQSVVPGLSFKAPSSSKQKRRPLKKSCENLRRLISTPGETVQSRRKPSLGSLNKPSEKKSTISNASQSTPKKRYFSTRKSVPSMTMNLINTNYVSRCAYKTRVGSIMGKPKKFNQDSFAIHPYIGGLKSQYLFAVLDGHGTVGHLVSDFVKTNLSSNIEEALLEVKSDDLVVDAVTRGIQKTDLQLKNTDIDTSYSGTTLTLALVRDDKLICANVGDSRAVIAKKVCGQWVASDLTNDHKPSLPSEQTRILKSGGRIEPFYGQDMEALGPERVWLKDAQVPGLAMSRSLGDDVAHSVGVSSEPEITTVNIDSDHKFMILATDGVWEFISSQEAVQIVGELFDKNHSESVCNYIVNESVIRWNTEDQSVDDITLIVIFLNGN